MKRIIIKNIRLLNFKGVRDMSIDFDASVTNVYGRNGSGKTTIFDAFTWLLFGKDSSDRQQFDIKTLDEDGAAIPQIPHEVSATISVNGADMTLTRRFTEKWVKRAGVAEREFDGNKEEHFFNNVPCSKSEYRQRIADICSEQVFKAITSPTYFTALKPEAQKAMLHRMTGGVTDEEVASGNEEFERLLSALNGKTLQDYRREIAAAKQRINTELSDIPGRIDERNRDIAEAEAHDWSGIENELAEKRKARERIDAQLFNIAGAELFRHETRKAAEVEVESVRNEIFKLRSSISEEVMREWYQEKDRVTEAVNRRRALMSELASINRDNDNRRREIEQCAKTRQTLLARYNELVQKRKAIAAETLTIDESQFVCPTCHRALDIADIEKKEAELMRNFDEDRAARLERTEALIEENKRDGRANNERRQYCQSMLEQGVGRAEAIQKEIEAIGEPKMSRAMPDPTDAIAAHPQMKKLEARLSEAESKLSEESRESDEAAELKAAHATLTESIEQLLAELSSRRDTAQDRKRVNELKDRMRALNVELASLERDEFTAEAFSKARSAAIESRIDGMFSRVRFRWTQALVNGTEKETCEASIDGIPYASLNHAGQITAGLDIINAICAYEQVSAPIFIDNAESINDIIPMQSQTINLIVSRDEKLRIEQNNTNN